MPELVDRARAWLADDPDPVTRDELTELLSRVENADGEALAELADRFAGFLEFGTAGLRGQLGAGPNRMNRAVVIRAAAGLAAYLRSTRAPASGRRHRVVVGYDARHGSAAFATDTAAVMTANDIEALVMPRPLPTPMLAFAVRHLAADAGVMVTASHNPRQDNGYKVYLGGPDGGAQIVSPTDTEVAAHIGAVTAVSDVARAAGGWEVVDEDVVDAYLTAAAGVARHGGSRDIRIVLTSLHGVGGAVAVEALRQAGFTDVHPVPEQAEPDPDFPTVDFPNPEEPGAIDLAVKLAGRIGADVVVAQDPDADRCAIALPRPVSMSASPPNSAWRILHGDELGALFGDHLARSGEHGVFASTVVSSRLLSRVAAARGIQHVETLTGFKWIARVPGLRYGYEEAIGYCVDPSSVRDKDGIAAAVLAAELVADSKTNGRTLWDRLDDLAVEHGLHATDQLTLRIDGTADLDAAMRRLRDNPPCSLADSAVTIRDDLRAGGAGLPPTDAMRYVAADGSRVIVRPSGTEPKLKCYLEVIVPVPTRGDLPDTRRVAADRLERLRADITAALAT